MVNVRYSLDFRVELVPGDGGTILRFAYIRTDTTGPLKAFGCSEVTSTYLSYGVQRAVNVTVRYSPAMFPV